jgi:hypothetical protein
MRGRTTTGMNVMRSADGSVSFFLLFLGNHVIVDCIPWKRAVWVLSLTSNLMGASKSPVHEPQGLDL